MEQYLKRIESPAGCPIVIEVYPDRELLASALTSTPAIASACVCICLIGLCGAFLFFDFTSRARLRDLEAMHELERRRAEVEREAIKGRFVFTSMVSHEIRTPASVIVGALDVLRDTVRLPAQREMLDLVAGASGEILTLVEDALAVGVDGEGRFKLSPSRVNPAALVRQSYRSVLMQPRYAQSLRGLRVDLLVAPGLPDECTLDAGRVRQVLANLMGNAVKFTPAGGSITVVAWADGDLLRCSVRDTGCGLTPEGIARLFRPFSQAEGERTKARFGGHGLGLLLSRDICRSMGGDLVIASDGPGQGAEAQASFSMRRTPDAVEEPPPGPSLRRRLSGTVVRMRKSSDGGERTGAQNAAAVAIVRRLRGSSDEGTDRPIARLPSVFVAPPVAIGDALAGELGGPAQQPATPATATKRSSPTALQAARSWLFGTAPLGPTSIFAPSLASAEEGESSEPSRRRGSSGPRLSVPPAPPPVTVPQPMSARVRGTSASSDNAPPGSPFTRPMSHASRNSSNSSLNGLVGRLGLPAPSRPLESIASVPANGADADADAEPPMVVAAEDDALCRRVLALTLGLAGFESPTVVADGEEAERAVAERPKRLRLLLLDANMGGGKKDGLESLIRIRKLLSDEGVVDLPPAVILTGETDPAVHQRFIDAGAARVLLKPVRLDALKELRGLISDTASASGEGRDSRSLSAGGGRPAEDDGSALEWAMRGKGGGPGPPPVKVRSASDI